MLVSKSLLLLFMGVSLAGCASYQHTVSEARSLLGRDPHQAALKLEKNANQEGKDQLVYLLDYATALQSAGDYQKSTEYFLKADQMADEKDYHSVTKITGSLLFNEGMVQYKGDDYEKLLINAMLAVNFLMQGDLDGALVETRRINEKLEYYRIEEKKNYDQNPFAVYLSALIWEADRKWDDAYIAFEKAYRLNPHIPYLREDLVRSAKRAQRIDTFNKWKKEFGIQWKKEWDSKELGELVVIYFQGWGPRKYPNPEAPRFPKLYPVDSFTRQAKVIVEEPSANTEEFSQMVCSVQDIAIKTFNDQYGALVAKRIAALATKEIVADQIRQKDESLGLLAAIVMHASDQADLRQWSLLPQSFQVAKLRLKPGEHTIRVIGLTDSGAPTGEESAPLKVTIQPGKKTFITWRSYR